MYVPRYTDQTRDEFGVSWARATQAQRDARKRVGYYGNGRYSVGSFVRDTRKLFGNKIIGAVNRNIVDAISGVGMYTGHGEYTNSNNLVSGMNGSSGSIPSYSSPGDETGSIVISHREYLGDVYGPTTAFSNQSYDLNPGLGQTFNWLSQIACNYDEYEFLQLVFEYRSTTTDIGSSTNGQCGTICMVTNYNAAQAPFADKQAMLDYAHSYSGKTTENLVHGVECDPSKIAGDATRYVRVAPVVTGQDIKTYDWGKFQMAIVNSPAGFQNQVIGELWVCYTVKLAKPRLTSQRGLDNEKEVWVGSNTCTPGNVATVGGWLGGSTVEYWAGQQNNLGCRITQATGGFSIIFPADYVGYVRVMVVFTANATVAGADVHIPTPTKNAGSTIVNMMELYDGDGFPTYQVKSRHLSVGDASGSDTSGTFYFFVNAAAPGVDNSLFFAAAAGVTSTGVTQILVEEYNGAGKSTATATNVMVNKAGVVGVPVL